MEPCEEGTRKPSAIERLLRRYEDQPVIRALVQLDPTGIASAVDTFVLARRETIQEERARAFYDELLKGRIELTPALLDSEDFLHCYFATANAAM